MKKLFILGAMLLALGMMTACHKDDQPTTQQDEQFSFSGIWYNPDISYLEDGYEWIVSPGLAEYHNFALQQTIGFIGNADDYWQGCFLWQKHPFDPNSWYEVPAPDSVYFKTNEAQNTIEIYIPSRSELYETSFQIVSPTEMRIGEETYIKHIPNPTEMVSLPNTSWHFDWHDGGFYFTGARLLDLNNPIIEMRGTQLYVNYEMRKSQAVRPHSNYNALMEQPHGWYIFAATPRSYEYLLYDYNGVQQYAMVQNNGGAWCDSICAYAFAGCKELNVVVLDGQVIGDYAFHGCTLTDIYLTGIPQDVSPTAFDEWQFEHTVIHTEKGYGLPQTAPWNRFKHTFADIVGGNK